MCLIACIFVSLTPCLLPSPLVSWQLPPQGTVDAFASLKHGQLITQLEALWSDLHVPAAERACFAGILFDMETAESHRDLVRICAEFEVRCARACCASGVNGVNAKGKREWLARRPECGNPRQGVCLNVRPAR